MAERKSQRAGKNSTARQTDSFGWSGASIPPPENVHLRDENDRIIWDQFTRARAREDWRDMDLILLAKVVRLEADLRKYQEKVDTTGPLIKNKRETLIENPLLRVIDTLQRQQLALIRSMSLTQTGIDPRQMDAAGRAENQSRKTAESLAMQELIAMPSWSEHGH